jgi:small redox-active disulfide protein 2
MIMNRIEVLGPGCSRCRETHRVVKHVVDESGLEIEVVKDESIERMMELGIFATPGVAIDGKVVMVGRVPRAAEVRQMLGIPEAALR